MAKDSKSKALENAAYDKSSRRHYEKHAQRMGYHKSIGKMYFPIPFKEAKGGVRSGKYIVQ